MKQKNKCEKNREVIKEKVMIVLIEIILFGIVSVAFNVPYTSALQVTQNVTVIVIPGDMRIYSPVQDFIYDSRMVPINISFSSDVIFKYAQYFDNEDRIVTLCRDCYEYGFINFKRKPFDNGFHNLRLIAVFDKGTIETSVNFTVDFNKPKILKIEPKKGFATNIFSAEILEVNPKEMRLTYGNDDIGYRIMEVDLSSDGDCYSIGKKNNKKKCDVEVNLNDYNHKDIKYWFNLTDIADSFVESEVKELNVDVSKPVLNNPDDFWMQGEGKNSKYIYFSLNITEDNLDEVVYNYVDSRGKEIERRLCNRLKNEMCEKREYFKKGNYGIEVRIVDKAGNSLLLEGVDFDVD